MGAAEELKAMADRQELEPIERDAAKASAPHRGMYEMESPELDEIAEALDDCDQLIELVVVAAQRAEGH